ncbi:MAG: prepilin peptidase [Candidatus Kaiserbacteria bacterium]|nr:prepilin peptidase [Candidatus Kaiserbacteria bacterium]MCB9816826.1 prepilin peptidase [Candidatus Nomurabacteria bacterium]
MFLLDLIAVPVGWLCFYIFGVGVIIGSFLNVYIYRFHTGKSLAGSSHCLSCGTDLKWYELVPLLSYLGLRGRCRTCGCRIPSRYFLVELATGLLFTWTLLIAYSVSTLFLYWFVMSVLVVITVYDLYHFIIPDKLTVVLTAAAVALLVSDGLRGGFSFEVFGIAVGAALLGSGFYLLLWLISKGQWLGFGDVKLAIPLGLLVGAKSVFSFVVLSFWVGAVISLLIIGYQYLSRGKASLPLPAKALTMKSAIPFAPFLVASCLIILFTHFNVLSLFYFL